MSAASQGFFSQIAQVLAGVVRGDLMLRLASLTRTGADSAWPAMLATAGVHTEFRYAMSAAARGRMRLLGPEKPRDDRRRPAAELTLRLGLCPGLGSGPHPLAHPTLELAAPLFLARPGAAERLRLVAVSGAVLEVGFPDEGQLRLAGLTRTLFGGDGFAADYQGDTLADWPLDALVFTLETLAAWRRAGEPRVTRRFRLPPLHTDLGRVLAGMAQGYGEIAGLLDGASPDLERKVADLRTSLAGLGLDAVERLALDSLEADVRLMQGDSGELLDDESELNRQRVDMLARLFWDERGPRISLAPRLSDISVDGDQHAAFLKTLREKAAIDALWAGFSRGHDSENLDFNGLPEPLRDWSKARLKSYLSDPAHDQEAIIARLRHDDTDLILMRDSPAEPGVRLLAQVTLAAPKTTRLAAIRSRSGTWATGGENLVPRYFYRLFRTLHAWQSGLEAGAP